MAKRKPYALKTGPKRFWKKVYKQDEGCWLWIGRLNDDGYATMMVNYAVHQVHRYSWILHKGQIPDGMMVLHRCDIRNCVNPDHLFLGTGRDNVEDAMAKQRHCHGESHGMAKLTEEDVKKIRLAYASGTRAGKIREEFNLSKSQLARIIRREQWKHV